MNKVYKFKEFSYVEEMILKLLNSDEQDSYDIEEYLNECCISFSELAKVVRKAIKSRIREEYESLDYSELEAMVRYGYYYRREVSCQSLVKVRKKIMTRVYNEAFIDIDTISEIFEMPENLTFDSKEYCMIGLRYDTESRFEEMLVERFRAYEAAADNYIEELIEENEKLQSNYETQKNDEPMNKSNKEVCDGVSIWEEDGKQNVEFVSDDSTLFSKVKFSFVKGRPVGLKLYL